jgi:hypothetical protein
VSARARLTPLILAAVALVLAGVWRLWWLPPDRTDPTPPPIQPVAAVAQASGWMFGGPLTADSLSGHVGVWIVWSDTDAPSLSMLSQAEAWSEAYARYGVRVVGVHAPDYAFATEPAVPRRVAARLGVRFPVALDAGLAVTSQLGASGSRPFVVITNPDGDIAATLEGARPDQVHRALKDALRASQPGIDLPPDPPLANDAHAPPPARRVFCGASRVAKGPLAGAVPGQTTTFTAQFRFQEEGPSYTPVPVGRWTTSADGITAARGGAGDYVVIRYNGGQVWAVLAPPATGASRVWILCDDQWLAENQRGADVQLDPRGGTYVDVTEPRVYAIASTGRGHVLRVSPDAPGVTLYEFAFVPR